MKEGILLWMLSFIIWMPIGRLTIGFNPQYDVLALPCRAVQMEIDFKLRRCPMLPLADGALS